MVLYPLSSAAGRRSSKLISVIVSAFTSSFVSSWSIFFHDQLLTCLPMFDGRTICYPTDAILRDYLSWRQADTHINNQVCLYLHTANHVIVLIARFTSMPALS